MGSAPRHIIRFKFRDFGKSIFTKISEMSANYGYEYLYMLIYSRKVEIFKCPYTHFAHIHLSFGCTDEKMDLGIYLDTSTC